MIFLKCLFNLFRPRPYERDKERTRSAYQSLQEIRLEALGSICQRLFQSNITTEQLQTELEALIKALSRLHYRCGWLGGSWIRLEGQIPKKVPRHIKRVFDLYQEKIPRMTQSTRHLSETTRHGLLLRFRNTIFTIITEAAERPPTLFCGLFRWRDNATTQAVYQTMAGYVTPKGQTQIR